ncbi:MAG: DsbA family protein [Pseudomonadota bacterium]
MMRDAGLMVGAAGVGALILVGAMLARTPPVAPAAPVAEAPRAAPAALTDVSNLFAETSVTPEQREVLHAEMRRYLLTNPDVITEVVGILEARRAAETAQAELSMVSDNAPEIFADGFSYVGGNPNGTINVVEFSDYKCPFCKRAHPEIAALLENNDDIRFIYKEYPVLGQESIYASRAALAVLRISDDETYRKFNDQLMAFGGTVSEQVVRRYAERFGLEGDAVMEAMNHPEIEAQIRRNHELGRTLGITGTPTFIFGEQIIRGYVPVAQMEEAVELVRRIVE